MGNGYHQRRRWADKFLPRQLRILRHVFRCDADKITLATPDDDKKRATDANIGQLKIALRMRRHSAIGNAGKDFLVRLRNVRGESEHEKIAANRVDFMLVGYADAEASADDVTADGIECWYLLDMRPLAKAVQNRMAEVMKAMVHDGDDVCMAVDIDSLTAAYGQTVRASGNISTATVTTTATDANGLTTSTTTTTSRTVTTSVDPTLAKLLTGWAD